MYTASRLCLSGTMVTLTGTCTVIVTGGAMMGGAVGDSEPVRTEICRETECITDAPTAHVTT